MTAIVCTLLAALLRPHLRDMLSSVQSPAWKTCEMSPRIGESGLTRMKLEAIYRCKDNLSDLFSFPAEDAGVLCIR